MRDSGLKGTAPAGDGDQHLLESDCFPVQPALFRLFWEADGDGEVDEEAAFRLIC